MIEVLVGTWLPLVGLVAALCLVVENRWRQRDRLVVELATDLYHRVKSGSGIEEALFSSRCAGAGLLSGRVRNFLDAGESMGAALKKAGESLGGGFHGLGSVLSCAIEKGASPSVALETLKRAMEEKTSMDYKRRRETVMLGVGSVLIGVVLLPMVMVLSLSITGEPPGAWDLVFLAWNGGLSCALFCVLDDRWLSLIPLGVLGGLSSILVASVMAGVYGGGSWLVMS